MVSTDVSLLDINTAAEQKREQLLYFSYYLDTSRTMILMVTDVSLLDVNQAVEQTPLKVLCQGYCLVVHFLLAFVIPKHKSHISMFEIRPIFNVTISFRNRNVWDMRDGSYDRRIIGGIGLSVYS